MNLLDDALPGWNDLVAAGRVEPPTAQVVDRAQQAIHRAVRQESASTPAPPSRIRARRPRHLVRYGLAAAAMVIMAASAAALLPPGGPGGPPAAVAAMTERLAVTAARTPADTVRPGQYRYTVLDDSNLMEGDTTPTTVRMQEWIADDGAVWRRDTSADGTVERYHFAIPADPTFGQPTPELLAALPRDPKQLLKHLRSVVRGSNSREEAVFVALTDMLKGRLADPQLRATMLRTIGLLPDVTITENVTDTRGRRGVALTWTGKDDEGRYGQSLVIDPTTAEVLEERSTYTYKTPQQPDSKRGLSNVTTLVETGVADAVPPDVLNGAK